MELSISKACKKKDFKTFSHIIKKNIMYFKPDDWEYLMERLCMSNASDLALAKELSQYINIAKRDSLIGKVNKRTLYRMTALISIINNDKKYKTNSVFHF